MANLFELFIEMKRGTPDTKDMYKNKFKRLVGEFISYPPVELVTAFHLGLVLGAFLFGKFDFMCYNSYSYTSIRNV